MMSFFNYDINPAWHDHVELPVREQGNPEYGIKLNRPPCSSWRGRPIPARDVES